MNFIKQHWKEILIALLVIFSLNKCSVACNRDAKINNQQTELIQKDSIIKVKSDSLNILKIRWNDFQTSQNRYEGLALGNQHQLLNEIESLQNINNEQSKLIKSQDKQINRLKKENQQLKKRINNE